MLFRSQLHPACDASQRSVSREDGRVFPAPLSLYNILLNFNLTVFVYWCFYRVNVLNNVGDNERFTEIYF